jgi:hypothetical protein
VGAGQRAAHDEGAPLGLGGLGAPESGPLGQEGGQAGPGPLACPGAPRMKGAGSRPRLPGEGGLRGLPGRRGPDFPGPRSPGGAQGRGGRPLGLTAGGGLGGREFAAAGVQGGRDGWNLPGAPEAAPLGRQAGLLGHRRPGFGDPGPDRGAQPRRVLLQGVARRPRVNGRALPAVGGGGPRLAQEAGQGLLCGHAPLPGLSFGDPELGGPPGRRLALFPPLDGPGVGLAQVGGLRQGPGRRPLEIPLPPTPPGPGQGLGQGLLPLPAHFREVLGVGGESGPRHFCGGLGRLVGVPRLLVPGVGGPLVFLGLVGGEEHPAHRLRQPVRVQGPGLQLLADQAAGREALLVPEDGLPDLPEVDGLALHPGRLHHPRVPAQVVRPDVGEPAGGVGGPALGLGPEERHPLAVVQGHLDGPDGPGTVRAGHLRGPEGTLPFAPEEDPAEADDPQGRLPTARLPDEGRHAPLKLGPGVPVAPETV